MTKEQIVGWLYSNYYVFDWSMKPLSIKIDFNDKSFISWVLTKKEFSRKNAQNPNFLKFIENLRLVVSTFDLTKLRNNKEWHISHGHNIKPEVEICLDEKIERSRRHLRMDLEDIVDDGDKLSDIIKQLSEIVDKNPNAYLSISKDYDDDFSVAISYEIMGQLESFEDCKERLEKEAGSTYERKLNAHNDYLKVVDQLKKLEGL